MENYYQLCEKIENLFFNEDFKFIEDFLRSNNIDGYIDTFPINIARDLAGKIIKISITKNGLKNRSAFYALLHIKIESFDKFKKDFIQYKKLRAFV